MTPAMTLGPPGRLPASSLSTRWWKKVGPQGRIPVLRTPLPLDMGLVGAVQTGNSPPSATIWVSRKQAGHFHWAQQGHPNHKGGTPRMWTVLPPGGWSHCCSAMCAPCCRLSPGDCICIPRPCTVRALASRCGWVQPAPTPTHSEAHYVVPESSFIPSLYPKETETTQTIPQVGHAVRGL